MSVRLRVRDISFGYLPSTPIFENISFDVECGQMFCILGPNGTGKSTLIKCLGNLLELDGGSIELDGAPIRSLSSPDVAKKVGYVPQGHISAFPYSVLQLVVMGRAPHLGIFSSPKEPDFRIARDSMELVGIGHLADRPCTDISGGEQQLALIARVLTQKPDVLLLDEPTSHLDFGNQMRILGVINKLAESGMTVVMSSHFPDHAFLTTGVVAIMKDGMIQNIGDATDVITEATMRDTYGIQVKVTDVGSGVDRRVCIPLLDSAKTTRLRLEKELR